MDDDAVMVLVRTTMEDRRGAEALARRLVEQAVACCVHVQEIHSVYPWEGKVQEGPEFLVEARTPAALRHALASAMAADHPYDTPLVEVIGETRVNPDYARWAAEATRPPRGD